MQILALQPQSFSRSLEHFFLLAGQNNFRNKILFLHYSTETTEETETAALDVTDANELLKALTDADPNSLGTVHILRKLIFRFFGPPSDYGSGDTGITKTLC